MNRTTNKEEWHSCPCLFPGVLDGRNTSSTLSNFFPSIDGYSNKLFVFLVSSSQIVSWGLSLWSPITQSPCFSLTKPSTAGDQLTAFMSLQSDSYSGSEKEGSFLERKWFRKSKGSQRLLSFCCSRALLFVRVSVDLPRLHTKWQPWVAFDPFTPKSDQFQISPEASPEKLHHTVWRTWLFIAFSDDYDTNSHYLAHFSIKGWENLLFELGSKRAKRYMTFVDTDILSVSG